MAGRSFFLFLIKKRTQLNNIIDAISQDGVLMGKDMSIHDFEDDLLDLYKEYQQL